MILRRYFLLKSETLYLLGKKLDYLHLNTRPLLPTATRTIDLQLKLDNGWLSLYLEILDYAIFPPMVWLKMRHILCWKFPYNPIRDEITSLFEDVVLGSLEYFF